MDGCPVRKASLCGSLAFFIDWMFHLFIYFIAVEHIWPWDGSLCILELTDKSLAVVTPVTYMSERLQGEIQRPHRHKEPAREGSNGGLVGQTPAPVWQRFSNQGNPYLSLWSLDCSRLIGLKVSLKAKRSSEVNQDSPLTTRLSLTLSLGAWSNIWNIYVSKMLIEAHANVGLLAVVESSDQTKTPSESTSQNIHAAMGTILMNSQRLFVLFLNGADPSDSTNIKDSVWLQNLCFSLTSVIADIQGFYFVD